MRPSPHTPALDDFPSSPLSVWSYTGSRSPNSAAQSHPSPPTPDSCCSPAPAVINPDEFALQIGLQLDKANRGSPHKLSLHSVSPLEMESSFLSESDSGVHALRIRTNSARGENMFDRFESSPPTHPRNRPRPPPLSRSSVGGDFSWEATRSAPLHTNELPDPTHCSLLIQEVSLLVGLTTDDDHLSPDDACPLVPNVSKQVPGMILPLNLTPTKSLSPRKHRNASRPHTPDTNLPVQPSNTPILPPGVNLRIENVMQPSLHNEKPLSAVLVEPVTPIARQKNVNDIRPSLSPHRRHGKVFHYQPPLGGMHQRAIHLDETFSHPREPPPKPTMDPPCSSLDRLECSLLKLKAHAPANHRQSRSEERPSDRVAQRKGKCPSLPPPRCLKKQQLNHEDIHRDPSRSPRVYNLPGSSTPQSRPALLRECATPRICSKVPVDDKHRQGGIAPGSFMDMDVPFAEAQKRQAHTSQFMGRKQMKSLANVARRLSRGVIAWGKNLAGPTRPSATA